MEGLQIHTTKKSKCNSEQIFNVVFKLPCRKDCICYSRLSTYYTDQKCRWQT